VGVTSNTRHVMVTTLETSCHEEVSSMMRVFMGETCFYHRNSPPV